MANGTSPSGGAGVRQATQQQAAPEQEVQQQAQAAEGEAAQEASEQQQAEEGQQQQEAQREQQLSSLGLGAEFSGEA